MIYTLTFHPVPNYAVSPDIPYSGERRVAEDVIFGGGKGPDISMVLSRLGMPSTALGFVTDSGSLTVEHVLQENGCRADFIHLPICSDEAKAVRIDEEALSRLFTKLNTLQKGDILILAGSIPDSLPYNIYERIMARLQPKQVDIAVDAGKGVLIDTMMYQPFLVNPTRQELSEIFRIPLHAKDEVAEHALELQEMGGRNILISMGSEGALLLTENGRIFSGPFPEGNAIHSTGAEAALIGGFLTGWQEKGDMEYAFRMGLAAAGACGRASELSFQDTVHALLTEL